MELHLGKFCVLFQLMKRIIDNRFFTRSAILQRHHKSIIAVLIAKKFLLFILRFFPLTQNIGDRFGHPHSTNTAFSLRCF